MAEAITMQLIDLPDEMWLEIVRQVPINRALWLGLVSKALRPWSARLAANPSPDTTLWDLNVSTANHQRLNILIRAYQALQTRLAALAALPRAIPRLALSLPWSSRYTSEEVAFALQMPVLAPASDLLEELGRFVGLHPELRALTLRFVFLVPHPDMESSRYGNPSIYEASYEIDKALVKCWEEGDALRRLTSIGLHGVAYTPMLLYKIVSECTEVQTLEMSHYCHDLFDVQFEEALRYGPKLFFVEPTNEFNCQALHTLKLSFVSLPETFVKAMGDNLPSLRRVRFVSVEIDESDGSEGGWSAHFTQLTHLTVASLDTTEFYFWTLFLSCFNRLTRLESLAIVNLANDERFNKNWRDIDDTHVRISPNRCMSLITYVRTGGKLLETPGLQELSAFNFIGFHCPVSDLISIAPHLKIFKYSISLWKSLEMEEILREMPDVELIGLHDETLATYGNYPTTPIPPEDWLNNLIGFDEIPVPNTRSSPKDEK